VGELRPRRRQTQGSTDTGGEGRGAVAQVLDKGVATGDGIGGGLGLALPRRVDAGTPEPSAA